MSPKKKIQNVSFNSIDDFLEFLPDEELVVVEALRQIVFECIPDFEEKLSYNVPYYKRFSNICFIWPASVKWGKDKSYEGVRLGFVNGNLLQDELNYLDKGNRKQVYWRDYITIDDINAELIKMYLFDAISVDEIRFKEKNKFSRSR